MNTRKKFFKTRKEANKEVEERNMYASFEYRNARVFKMKKGTRHVGQYFVGSEMEYINAD